MPMTRPGAERALRCDIEPDAFAEAAQQRRDRQRGEVAVDDRRNAGEDLEQRLRVAAEAPARVLGEIDRGHQADRHGHEHREPRDQQRAREQRHCAEGAGSTRLDRRESPFAGSRTSRTGIRAAKPAGRTAALRRTRTGNADRRQDRRRTRPRSVATRSPLDAIARAELGSHATIRPREDENAEHDDRRAREIAAEPRSYV